MNIAIPTTHSILTSHTCRSGRGATFFGKVIAFRPNSRGGIVVWVEEFKSRGIALRSARATVRRILAEREVEAS